MPSGSSACWTSATRRLSRCSKRRRSRGGQPNVDECGRTQLSSPDAMSSSAACRSIIAASAAAAQLFGHRLVALQDEEPCDAPVELLGERPHLARPHDADEPCRLEHLQVVADGALRRLEDGCELGRARRSLAEQHDDAGAQHVAERAELLRVFDDEDVVEVVVRVTVDDRGTYGKSRPLASGVRLRRRGADRGRGLAR